MAQPYETHRTVPLWDPLTPYQVRWAWAKGGRREGQRRARHGCHLGLYRTVSETGLQRLCLYLTLRMAQPYETHRTVPLWYPLTPCQVWWA